MKVGELIERLESCNHDAEVNAHIEGFHYVVGCDRLMNIEQTTTFPDRHEVHLKFKVQTLE